MSDRYPDPLTFEEAVAFFSDFCRGKHHIPNGQCCGIAGVKRHGNGWKIHVSGDLSTWDFDELTRLVFLAHDYRYRASVETAGRSLRIAIWRRFPTGDMSVRHPSLEQAVDAWRERHPPDVPRG